MAHRLLRHRRLRGGTRPLRARMRRSAAADLSTRPQPAPSSVIQSPRHSGFGDALGPMASNRFRPHVAARPLRPRPEEWVKKNVDLCARDRLLKHSATVRARWGRYSRPEAGLAGDSPWDSSWQDWSAASPWVCCSPQSLPLRDGSPTASIAVSSLPGTPPDRRRR